MGHDLIFLALRESICDYIYIMYVYIHDCAEITFVLCIYVKAALPIQCTIAWVTPYIYIWQVGASMYIYTYICAVEKKTMQNVFNVYIYMNIDKSMYIYIYTSQPHI